MKTNTLTIPSDLYADLLYLKSVNMRKEKNHDSIDFGSISSYATNLLEKAVRVELKKIQK